MASQGISDEQTLQCMEIWGGFQPMERSVSTPGLDLWVFSQPFHGDEHGGDVYYVTLCGGGVITRIVVADVSGHGASVAEFSSSLRTLLRRNINQKSQKRLVEQLNRQFGEMADSRRFATALVVTYLATADRLSISNAGHPRPLLYRAIDREWSSLTPQEGDRHGPGNLPLGLDEHTSYASFDLQLKPGDRVVFYTDALIEAADPSGRLLGESGLVETARGLNIDLDSASPGAVGSALLEAVASHRGRESADDDVTVVVLNHNAAGPRRLSLAQKADVYAKVFGLKRV
jgi:phosphoserine phosphatase RsbU/P